MAIRALATDRAAQVASGFYSDISAAVGSDQRVGAVLSEEQLREILKANIDKVIAELSDSELIAMENADFGQN